jgi:excisionase family DNA binding protein
MIDRRLSMSQVRRLSGFSEDTVLREIRRGNLPGEKVCNRWRFRESAVLQWLNPGKVECSGASGRTSRARAVGGNATANANYAVSDGFVGGSTNS